MKKICYLGDAESIHTRKWIEYFSKKDYEIYVISMRNTSYQYNKNVHIYTILPPYKSKLSYFMVVPKVIKLVKTIKPDILHSHYATSYGLYGRLCNYHPFIISVWGSDIYEFPNGSFLKKNLLKFILKGADIVCSTSLDMAEETQKYYKMPIEITPFGVDVHKFNMLKPVLSNDFITIGIVKSLEKVYGIEYLIKAFSRLLKEMKNVKLKLLIVGEGTEKNNLIKLSIELGVIDYVTFAGAVDNKLVPEYINMMDIVCMPSLMESFGVSAVEACACGRPVIATNVGGLKEIIIDDLNGYLVTSRDYDDLADKIKKIISNKNTFLQLSLNARNQAVLKYDWNENAKIMEKIYDKLIVGR